MLKIVHEIRRQPLHVRKVFAVTLTILTFSAVGFFWVRSTQKQVVAMLHGTANTSTTTELADKKPSPFAAIKQSFKDLKATIGGFWSHRSEFSPSKFQQNTQVSPIPTNKLPVSSP